MIDFKVYICRGCKIAKQDVITKRRHCFLCQRSTSPFELPLEKKQSKDIKRFPREITVDPHEKEIIKLINERCRDFDCPGNVTEVSHGPVVTQYKFVPDRFTRIKKIKNITEDLAMSLSAENVSMSRLPGEAAIGIYIPNKERKTVTFAETLKNVIAHRNDMELPINFGTSSTGLPYVEDLTLMPHICVAGSTGTGKSVFLNNIISSLVTIRSPKELQLVMIDPKTVELFQYKDLPHLRWAPEADVFRSLGLLENLISEMRRRTANLHGFGAKSIKEYNDRIKTEVKVLEGAGKAEEAAKRMDDTWPYIVVVIDEMADLVIQEKKAFTERLAEISAMSRAAGIHLICATQRPSVDVLSGKIKVNFPARVAFRVPAAVDSKTILNQKGAETLLGKGDMFYVSPNRSGVMRLHAPWTTQEDVEKVKRLAIEFGFNTRKVPADIYTALPPSTLATITVAGGKARVN